MSSRDRVVAAYEEFSLSEDGRPVCLTGAHDGAVGIEIDDYGVPACLADEPCEPSAMLASVGLSDDQIRRVVDAEYDRARERERAETKGLKQEVRRRSHDDDIDNAEMFVEQHEHHLRWSPERNAWLHYCGTHWMEDSGGAAIRMAMQSARHLNTLAHAAGRSPRAASLSQRARQLGQRSRLVAMVELAKSMLEIREEELDGDPLVLNVLNGTLHLRSGELLNHDRRDLLTMLAPVEYRPDAFSTDWEDFLRTSIPDEEERAFLGRMAGYCLTGLTSEERFFFIHGPAGSGKSTFVEALAGALGPYAATADPALFLKSQRPTDANSANPALVHLVHRRLVVSSEPPRGRSWDEGFLKRLTGGDRLTTRQNYGRTFEFSPQFALVVVGNSRPPVEDDAGGAMGRRLVEVPFPVPAGDRRDDRLKARLTDPAVAGAAILAWAVEGCREWQADGLGIPDGVAAATQAYWDEQADNDPVRAFLDERYERTDDPADLVPTVRLAAAYNDSAAPRDRLSSKKLTSRLRELGLVDRKTGGGNRYWAGLKPVAAADPAAPGLTWDQALDGAEASLRSGPVAGAP